jgi:hypothetical protein
MPLLNAVHPKIWKDNFSKRFSNFCKKSPVLISLAIKIEGGEEGALITHINSGLKYFFAFDYDMPVKDFIAEIKIVLVAKHYPRLIEEVLEKHELTSEELAIKVEQGADINHLNKYEMRTMGTRQFRLDKVLAWKNIAILTLEQSSFPDDDIGANFRYKFNGSIIIFLKNYRSGKYKTLEDASSYFFSNSLLIDLIEKKEEEVQSS